MDSYYKLGVALTLKDVVSGGIEKIIGNTKKLKSQLEDVQGGVEKYNKSMGQVKAGSALMAAGTGVLALSGSMINASRESSVLQSNLASLGLAEESINKIDQAAIKMSGSMGIAREDILSAAYDIKSGIETIDDNAIGAFSESVAKAAVATKGDTTQFASLFGTIYNQNKKLYGDLSDQDFGNKIANNLSHAVQLYKTDGAKMQQAIESVSGAAAAAGYDMAEQFNVLGMLQNVMNPGEAGTAFRSFVDKSSSAAGKLGMSFTDAQGQLLPVTDIMSQLEAKFGDTLSASEALQIKEAFGSDEAVKLVNNLWGKTGKLNENIEAMRAAGGTEIVDGMAAANLDNVDTSLNKVSEGMQNLNAVIGGGMGAAIKPVVDLLGGGLSKLAGWGKEHPKIMAVVGGFITFGGVAMVVGGAILFAKGMMGLYTLSQIAAAGATGAGTAVNSGFSIATIAKTAATVASTAATGLATAAQWALNAAFLGCPIVWIVVGIGAIIAAGIALYKNWDYIKEKAVGAWNWIKNSWGEAPGWMKAVIGGAFLFITGPIGAVVLAGIAVYKNFDLIKAKGGEALTYVQAKILAIPNAVGGMSAKVFGFFTSLPVKARQSGIGLITAFVGGITSKIDWMKEKVSGGFALIKRLFPHSDAPEGPFSNLTASGSSVITTFESGIEKESQKKSPSVKNYMQESMNTMQSESSLPKPKASGSRGQLARNTGMTIHIEKLVEKLVLSGSKEENIRELAAKLAELLFIESERYGNGTA